MTSKEKESEKKLRRDDSLIEDIFDSYKQSIVVLFLIIAYNIIPAGIMYLGYYLAKDEVDFTALISDPSTILNQTLHYGLYIIGVGLILFLIGFAAAFLYTASRNDRIAKPLSFMKAYLSAWGILLQYAIILAIFGGLYFGITYVNNYYASLAVGIVCAVIGVITPLAMIFRVIDFLLELE